MSFAAPGWEEVEGPRPRITVVAGVEVGRGSRVVLRPRAGGDIFDQALNGRVAIVDRLDQNLEGGLSVAVVIEEDPGRDMGERRQPGHRFFFSLEEIEPLAAPDAPGPARTRVLVAGIGNIFLGDDGFGVEVARRFGERELPAGVDVADFGIRGMDLVYALGDDYDAAIFVDAVPRGQAPGTLYVIEPEVDPDVAEFEAHGMDPVKVLALARTLGGELPRTLVVGCEPRTRMALDDEELRAELSPPVAAALDGAERLVRSLLDELLADTPSERRTG
jgi:hydrogenase maturation protease